MHVNLLPGVRLNDVTSTLRDQHAQLGNIRNGTATQRYDSYFQWANRAASMFRFLLRPESVEALVLTPVYWRLVQLTPHQTAGNSDIVDRETQDGLERLASALRWLDERHKVWAAEHFLVTDTSFLIKGPKLEDADLRELVGARHHPIHWFFPIIVLDELDRLKETKQQPARWRSAYTLAVLERIIQNPKYPGRLQDEDFSGHDAGVIPRGQVMAEVVLDPPGHMRLPLADDELIDRAVALEALCGRAVTFVTYDTSQAMRARGAGLKVKRLRSPVEDEPEPDLKPPPRS